MNVFTSPSTDAMVNVAKEIYGVSDKMNFDLAAEMLKDEENIIVETVRVTDDAASVGYGRVLGDSGEEDNVVPLSSFSLAIYFIFQTKFVSSAHDTNLVRFSFCDTNIVRFSTKWHPTHVIYDRSVH